MRPAPEPPLKSSLIPTVTARRDHARSREDRSVDSASQADWAGADSPITIQVELGRKLKGYAHRNPVTQSIFNLNHESQSRSQSQSRPQSQSRTVTNPCHDHRYYHLPYSDSVAIIAFLQRTSLSRITNHIQTQSRSPSPTQHVHEHRRKSQPQSRSQSNSNLIHVSRHSSQSRRLVTVTISITNTVPLAITSTNHCDDHALKPTPISVTFTNTIRIRVPRV